MRRRKTNRITQFNIRRINEDKCGKIYSTKEMKIDAYKLEMEIRNFLRNFSRGTIDFSNCFPDMDLACGCLELILNSPEVDEIDIIVWTVAVRLENIKKEVKKFITFSTLPFLPFHQLVKLSTPH